MNGERRSRLDRPGREVELVGRPGLGLHAHRVLRIRVHDDARAVGKATVAGVSTTEYRGTVSRTRAEARLEQMPEEVRDQQRAALEQMFATRSELPVRVWLDDQDQLRRMSMRIEVSGATATVDMTMLEYGVPVDVQAPPAGEVIEYREFQRLAQRPSPNLA